MKILIIILSLLSISCSSNNFQSRVIENYYQSAGVEKFFLSEIPSWANFSELGNCKRNVSIRFFDLELLMKNYNLNFSQALQIQASFNGEYINLVNNNPGKTIPLNDEQLLFFKASDKVNGKILFFNAPSFKKINLVWIDEAIANEESINKLKKFLNSRVFDSGVPVLVSYCLSKSEIDKIFHEQNYPSLSTELLSIYNADGTKNNFLGFNLENLFKQDQEINFYSKSKLASIKELIGKIKLNNY